MHTSDVQGLLEQLAQAVKDGRADIEYGLWEYARGDRLLSGRGEEMAKLAAQLVVIDDIYQDLMMAFLPWRMTHEEKPLFLALAKDVARWNQKGQSLKRDTVCSCGERHEEGSIQQLAHLEHGQTYLFWSNHILSLITEYVTRHQ